MNTKKLIFVFSFIMLSYEDNNFSNKGRGVKKYLQYILTTPRLEIKINPNCLRLIISLAFLKNH
jgi:hypothetical protein